MYICRKINKNKEVIKLENIIPQLLSETLLIIGQGAESKCKSGVLKHSTWQQMQNFNNNTL